jgi:hypothetical protein
MDYGDRPDGSKKGTGFFGEIKRPDGNVMTEISVGVGLNGKEVNIPLIVPTLDKKEMQYLLRNDPSLLRINPGLFKGRALCNLALAHCKGRRNDMTRPLLRRT